MILRILRDYAVLYYHNSQFTRYLRFWAVQLTRKILHDYTVLYYFPRYKVLKVMQDSSYPPWFELGWGISSVGFRDLRLGFEDDPEIV